MILHCCVKRTNETNTQIRKKSKEIITVTCNKEKRKVPRDPSDDYHISNLQETIISHGPPVHLHAHYQCTATSRKPVQVSQASIYRFHRTVANMLHLKGKLICYI